MALILVKPHPHLVPPPPPGSQRPCAQPLTLPPPTAPTGVPPCSRTSQPRRVKPASLAHPLPPSARPSFSKPMPASNSGVPPLRLTSLPPMLVKALCSSGFTALDGLSPSWSPLLPRQLPRCHFQPCTRCCPLSVVPPPEHHTDHLSLSPACVPRGLASTGPGRGGKGCLIAARRSAAKRPTGGLPTRLSHVPRRLHSRGLLLQAVRHGRASRSVRCLFQLTLCAGGGGPLPAPVL